MAGVEFANDMDDVTYLGGLRPAFLAVHIIGGQVGLPLLVLTFLLSKAVSRHPTLINFCITWIIYSIVYCLSLYDGPLSPLLDDSADLLCVVQAALVYGAPPMAASAGLILIIYIWCTFQNPWQAYLDKVPRCVQLLIMLSPPHITFIAYSVAAGVVGFRNPGSVSPANGLYCTTVVQPFNRIAVPVSALAAMVLTVGFEVAIATQYGRQWTNMRKICPWAVRQINHSLCFRVFVFSVCSWITLVSCVLFISESDSSLRHMVPACLPLVAVIVFGTQKDLFQAWYVCRRGPQRKGSVASVDYFPSARLSEQREDDL